MIRRLPFLLLFICFIFSPALAEKQALQEPENNLPPVDFKSLKHTKSGRVDKIIDGLTILLKDGTIIRLSSIDIPDFHIWRDAPLSDQALTLLEKTLPEGTEVLLYQTRMAKKGRINRKKQVLAHIQTKKEPIWIQGLLLSEGLARIHLTPGLTEMTDQMLSIEKAAREKEKGLWGSESEYKVLSPDTVVPMMNEFVVVEGMVQKVATVRNNIYLNFGKDWKTDFTIMITPQLRKKIAHAGINLLGLANQKVRVRGWLREYNGPLIELDEPRHLEIIEADNLQTTPNKAIETPSIKS